MKKISKFHIGMIKASALGVLNAIAKDKYKAAIVKATKLIELSVKLGIEDLKTALPASVVTCIKNFIGRLIRAIDGNSSLCNPLVHLFGMFVIVNKYALPRIEVLKRITI